jgi:hypothetical protein
MIKTRQFLPLLLTLLTSSYVCAQDSDFPGVRELMLPAEFEAAGLEKLTPGEMEALRQWLIRYTAEESPAIRRNSQAVKTAEINMAILADITGDFSGWSGETVFELDNGQVWRQRLRGRFNYPGSERAVEIRKNILGFYWMTHIASGKSVAVSRVK